MNNRGWLRIVEASVAILIVLSALVVVYVRSGSSNQVDLSERARDILNEVAKNITLREAILMTPPNMSLINNSISKFIPEQNLRFETRVCNVGDACGKLAYSDAEVYAAERIVSVYISSDANKLIGPDQSKKIRLFIWRGTE